VLSLVIVLSCSLWPMAEAMLAVPGQKPSEYEVEAAYLFNFGKFVTWPANAAATASGQPLTICVLGEDPFGETLYRLVQDEKIGGKTVADRQISRPEDAASCAILYISSSEESRLNHILLTLKDAPVLTVSDIAGFLDRGGMVQFIVRGSHVRFAVNLAPVQRDHMMLSSELLKVAVSVKRAGGIH
jgi:hypothetical protein